MQWKRFGCLCPTVRLLRLLQAKSRPCERLRKVGKFHRLHFDLTLVLFKDYVRFDKIEKTEERGKESASLCQCKRRAVNIEFFDILINEN